MEPSSKEPDAAPLVLQAETAQLKARLSPERWALVCERAHERAEILREVASTCTMKGKSERGTVRALFPEIPWPTYVQWKRRTREARGGEAWERQLDERVPPAPYRVSARVREGACLLRRVTPTVTCEEARRHLKAQFGDTEGAVSDTSLHRIWKTAGLAQPVGTRSRRGTHEASPGKVERFACGGGLALLAAAVAETKVGGELATAVLGVLGMTVGGDTAPPTAKVEGATGGGDEAAESREGGPQERMESTATATGGFTADPGDATAVPVPDGTTEHAVRAGEAEGRDARGRFTSAYNRTVHGDGGPDPRWQSDAEKRQRRDLSTLALARSKKGTVAHKLLAIGLMPLLTERRGFDGMDGPSGGWLGVMGGTPYKAATLDKALSELALLNVEGALWRTHAQQWGRLTKPWGEGECPRWVRWALYIDATQDPYWTRHFAMSGKVSRIGRIMPSLTRVAIMGGPGVPLWVETRAGTVSLKKELLPVLERFGEVVGDGELGRLTIIDAEMATVPLLLALSARKEKWFITVLKGALGVGAETMEQGPWQRYRERDRLRELKLRVHGKEAPTEGLVLRAVEMEREGSRNPTSTRFITNASPEELSTEEVASAYLSRWPHQERRFRDGRNGSGLEHSHGYGGTTVTHVALATAQEKAQGRQARAELAVTAAKERSEAAKALYAATAKDHRAAARAHLVTADAEARRAQKALRTANEEVHRLATTPKEIYVRDTTRDGIVTCLKLTALMLIEYALKEYFGGLRMEVRTFIEHFVWLPVTVRETPRIRIYEIEASARSPTHTEQLRAACAEVTRRGIIADGKRLRFDVHCPGVPPTG